MPWDHPRVCGEYSTHAYPLLWNAGSPPRVRGVLYHIELPDRGRGITPACAGSTRSSRPDPRGRGDHPRVCGEYNRTAARHIAYLGSPPRVRGVRCTSIPNPTWFWITPACAGSTQYRTGIAGAMEDHPRVCGEYPSACDVSRTAAGSPPRVRGVHGYVEIREFKLGITPACAGSTPTVRSMRYCRRDHPRVCGEYNVMTTALQISSGSPPRVRGVH